MADLNTYLSYYSCKRLIVKWLEVSAFNNAQYPLSYGWKKLIMLNYLQACIELLPTVNSHLFF